jgi:hypothetical protein
MMMKFNEAKHAFLTNNNLFTLEHLRYERIGKGKLTSFRPGTAMPDIKYQMHKAF